MDSNLKCDQSQEIRTISEWSFLNYILIYSIIKNDVLSEYCLYLFHYLYCTSIMEQGLTLGLYVIQFMWFSVLSTVNFKHICLLVGSCGCLCVRVHIIDKKWKIYLCYFDSPFFTTLIWICGRQELCKCLLFTSIKWYLDNTHPKRARLCERVHIWETHLTILHSERWMSLLCCFTNHDYLVCVWDGVSKRIFADKHVRENSSLNRDNPKTLKSHANVGYFLYIFLTWPTLFQQTTFVIYSERMALGLCYHI